MPQDGTPVSQEREEEYCQIILDLHRDLYASIDAYTDVETIQVCGRVRGQGGGCSVDVGARVAFVCTTVRFLTMTFFIFGCSVCVCARGL